MLLGKLVSLTLISSALCFPKDERLLISKRLNRSACRSCSRAKSILVSRCGRGVPDNTVEAKEYMACICNLSNRFFDQFTDCIEYCRAMDGTGLPHDEVEMRRMYCELADSFSSILSTGTGTEHESRPTNGSFGIHVTRDHGDFGNGRHYTSVGFIATNAEGSTLFSHGVVAETRRTGTDSGGNPRSGILFPSLLYVLVFIVVGFVM